MQQSVHHLERLATMPPGADLAAALAGVDLAGVPNDRVIDLLQAQARQLAHDQARMLASIVEVARSTPFSDPDDPDLQRLFGAHRAMTAYDWASGELAAALTLTARAADRELHFAETVVEQLPWVFSALLAGQIDRAKAWVFADHLDPATGELVPEQIEEICARFVPLAAGLTTGQLAARLLRAVIAIDPAHARRRYHRAVRDRQVSAYLDRNGTVTITATGLPPDEAAAACDRLEALAAAARRAGHPGRLAQIQADLFLGMLGGAFHRLTEDQIVADLLARPPHQDGEHTATSDPSRDDPGGTRAGTATPDPSRAEQGCPQAGTGHAGGCPVTEHDRGGPAAPGPTRTTPGAPGSRAGERAGFEIRVGLATLLGLDEHPGEIPGLGPVLADVARAAVAAQRHGAQWRFAITDTTGHLILAGVTRRRPQLDPDKRGTGSRCSRGIVELHLPATLLDVLRRDAAACGSWAGVIADIAAQYDRRDRLTAALDQHPTDRFAHAALARHIQIRDRTCAHPGCRRPARKSDLDHTRDHARAGPSTQANIGPGCRRHHLFKHELGWRLRQPRPGHFEWTSPLGRSYRTRGEPITPQLPQPRPNAPRPEQRADTHAGGDYPTILRLPPPETAPQPPPAPPATPDEPTF